jgi:quercetin dioxygenase-like cupin family protein
MLVENLLENLEFHDKHPYSQPLFVDEHGRILRFMLKPGQSIIDHNVPHSPFYIVVLQGQGIFKGGDGKEIQCGPNTLLIFNPAENHGLRALDENLVFIGFLQGVPTTRPGKIGGELGREAEQQAN